MHKKYRELKLLGNLSIELGGKHKELRRRRFNVDTGTEDVEPLIRRFNTGTVEAEKDALEDELEDITEFLTDIYEAEAVQGQGE